MAKIGIIAGSFKPLQSGHYALISMAARDNDEVHLYVSLSDRARPGEVPIVGADMKKLWDETIEPSLPANVTVTYGGSPIGHVYKELGDADKAGSHDTFSIYSDPGDLKANYATLGKYAGNLLAHGQIKLRPIERSETVNVSGTQMRQWLGVGDKVNFTKHLPKAIDRDLVWRVLSARAKDPPKDLKATDRARGPRAEALLRHYVKLLLGR